MMVGIPLQVLAGTGHGLWEMNLRTEAEAGDSRWADLHLEFRL